MGDMYIKLLRRGLDGDRVAALENDGQRWRWIRLLTMSNEDTFPGLIIKSGMNPMSDVEIIGNIFKETTSLEKKLEQWEHDKAKMREVGLINTTALNGGHYIWTCDYHSYQDKASKVGARLKDHFYRGFLGLENDKDRAKFVVLLSRFKPRGVNLAIFSIPEIVGKSELFIEHQNLPLFSDNSPEFEKATRASLAAVTDEVRRFEIDYQTKRGGDSKEFVNWWNHRFREVRGGSLPYTPGPKDYKLIHELLKTFSVKELQSLADRFLRDRTDPYIRKAGYTIGTFKLNINKLVSLKGERHGASDFSRDPD